MLGFIDAIDLHNRANSLDSVPNEFSSSEKAYRRFLIYSNFYAAGSPVIICEGETDPIYLTHAIRSLAAEFPQLAEVKNGKIRIKIRLYKYPRSSAARVLQLNDGGSGVLGKFIATYKAETGRFNAPGQENPVVILYDNDEGAKAILNVIKNCTGMKVTAADPFVRIVNNMYALPVPCLAGKTKSKIEDCFDVETKETVVDGKTLNDSNDGIDTEKHYSKKVFAYQVVQAKADIIDFSGFRPLLTNLVSLIEAHTAAAGSGA